MARMLDYLNGILPRQEAFLVCDDCDIDSHVRLSTRRHFLCLDLGAVWTGSQRPLTMRVWWPTLV